MHPFKSKEMIARFFSKVNMKGRRCSVLRSCCWVWLGNKRNNYGLFATGSGVMKSAHRLSYQYFKNKNLKNFEVLHKCDNPSCVNPSHLELGNHKKNMQDASKRGLLKTKFSSNDVARMRKLKINGTSNKEIFKIFNVSQSYLYRISKYQRRAF